MLDLDLKSVAVGVVISIAAGGGLYGMYVKTAGEAGKAQAKAYGLMGECATLMSSSDADQIREFMARSNESLPDIQKSDAVVTAVSAAVADSTRVAGLGTSLSMCLQGLESHLKRVNRG